MSHNPISWEEKEKKVFIMHGGRSMPKPKDKNLIFRLKKQVICSVSIKCISIRFPLKLDYFLLFYCVCFFLIGFGSFLPNLTYNNVFCVYLFICWKESRNFQWISSHNPIQVYTTNIIFMANLLSLQFQNLTVYQ